MSDDLSPVRRVVDGLGECSREEQVAVARLLMDIIRSWPDSPARTFVSTVTEAVLAGADDIQGVLRRAEREYLPGARREPAVSGE